MPVHFIASLNLINLVEVFHSLKIRIEKNGNKTSTNTGK